MKPRLFKPLLFPAILLVVGLALGQAAETAVGRYQNYGLYGLLRPTADALMLIAGVWLVVALLTLIVRAARRRLKPAAPRV